MSYTSSHAFNRLLVVTSFLLLPLIFSAAPQTAHKKFIVRRGDTASYLAIRYYGFFNDSLFAVLKTANAHIKDINLIHPGDSLLFPHRAVAEPKFEQLRTSAAQAVLTFYDGPVQYRRGGKGDFAPVTPNLLLNPNDEIQTQAKARAELVLDNRSVIRLAANSQLKITKLLRPDKPAAAASPQPLQAQFDLSLGSLWTRVNKLFNRPSKVDVKFPTAIAGVQGTIYRATVAADSVTNVRVYDGTVEVRGGGALFRPSPGLRPGQIPGPQQVPGPQQITLEAWVKLVQAQQQVVIGKDGRPSEPNRFTDARAELDWVRWNQQRDLDLDAERQ